MTERRTHDNAPVLAHARRPDVGRRGCVQGSRFGVSESVTPGDGSARANAIPVPALPTHAEGPAADHCGPFALPGIWRSTWAAAASRLRPPQRAGSVVQDERHHRIDLVLDDLAAIDTNLLLLDPGAADVTQRFRCACDAVVDGILEALPGRRTDLGDASDCHVMSLRSGWSCFFLVADAAPEYTTPAC